MQLCWSFFNNAVTSFIDEDYRFCQISFSKSQENLRTESYIKHFHSLILEYMKKEILSNYYIEWSLCWMTMMSDSYAEWLLRWVIKMINMLHRFTLSVLVHRYLNTWKEKTILFNAYFIDARSFTDLSQLFSEKVIELDDILNFLFADTWILEKRR